MKVGAIIFRADGVLRRTAAGVASTRTPVSGCVNVGTLPGVLLPICLVAVITTTCDISINRLKRFHALAYLEKWKFYFTRSR